MIQRCDWKLDPENPPFADWEDTTKQTNKHLFVLVFLMKGFMPTPLIQALSSILFIVFMVQPMSSPYMYLINVQSLYLNSLSIVGDWMGGYTHYAASCRGHTKYKVYTLMNMP